MEPALVKITEQEPLPAEMAVRLKLQFVFAPVIFTVPVATVAPEGTDTVTLTVTSPLTKEGSGVSAVMVVVVVIRLVGPGTPHRLNGDE